ncbi:hypothetical protein AHAS_Ahas04G0014300 [Arachis hypogaea]
MDLRPKTEPASPPIPASSGNHGSLNELSISELFSDLRTNCDKVEEVLLARDAKHKAEIDSLVVKYELEMLQRLHTEDQLKKKEQQYQNLERKWLDDNDAIAELRIRCSELEDENKKNLETIQKLKDANYRLEKEKINEDERVLNEMAVPDSPPFKRKKGIGHCNGESERMTPNSVAMKILRATRKNDVARGIQLKEGGETATLSSPSKSDSGASASRKVIPILESQPIPPISTLDSLTAHPPPSSSEMILAELEGKNAVVFNKEVDIKHPYALETSCVQVFLIESFASFLDPPDLEFISMFAFTHMASCFLLPSMKNIDRVPMLLGWTSGYSSSPNLLELHSTLSAEVLEVLVHLSDFGFKRQESSDKFFKNLPTKSVGNSSGIISVQSSLQV